MSRETENVTVYMAGPMTNGGGPAYNLTAIKDAFGVFIQLVKEGYTPICPQMTAFVEFAFPGALEYEDWMTLDERLIDSADVLLRLPGPSSGADHEVAYAESIDCPVVYTVEELHGLYPHPREEVATHE